MLKEKTLSHLKDRKNLLAFSGGADSTALFFLLIKHNIIFDIAIVNYGVREQSKQEVAYAKELCTLHNLTCHIHNAAEIKTNFEAKAREIRYDFFEELILKHGYENLLSAHHLGDRFEWMLMQFCKGSGCAELAGMRTLEQRKNYKLIRPLLHLDKCELLIYLKHSSIKYFEDESNFYENIKRNSFRHNHSNPLLAEHLSGIKKSFEYLDEDRDSLIKEIDVYSEDEFVYFKNFGDIRSSIYAIDKYLKSKLYMLSAKERELLKGEKTVVVGRKFVISQNSDFIFMSPFVREVVMPKKFKEECRVLKIEPKLRPYLFKNDIVFQEIKKILIGS
ncbi:tRNA lysidine(34) synthetase TilS [Sulfurimonas sp.]|uniref:tRNA lysidine(34) synthetase TilS n=1 Tax=Sulfurimonas sp. TaxID=2022749 RepID=UPI0025EA245A|nr:tRNA lysidine(34) synthetase TilS [Sulfurimonas sp.]MDD5157296.1 tRNA lysidine(34) synthetase TilS [Sulfurimonas sp.]